jgi:hypothetical protein
MALRNNARLRSEVLPGQLPHPCGKKPTLPWQTKANEANGTESTERSPCWAWILVTAVRLEGIYDLSNVHRRNPSLFICTIETARVTRDL